MVELPRDQALQRLVSQTQRPHAVLGEQRLVFWREGFNKRLFQTRTNLFRHRRRRDDADPVGRLESRKPRFRYGRDFGQLRQARQARDRERAQRAVGNVPMRAHISIELEIDMARDHIGERLRCAAIGNLGQRDLRAAFEQLNAEVRKRPDAGRPIGERVRLCVVEQFRKGLDRQCGIDHEDARQIRQQRNRRKILDRVIRQLVHDRGLRGK